MDRKTRTQAAAVFVVTLAVGFPFALQVGQWLAGDPEPARRPAPAPVATGAGTDPGQPRERQPEGGTIPGYGPQSRPMLAGTGQPAPAPATATSTPVPPGLTGGPTSAPIDLPTAPPSTLPTPPAGDPTEPPGDEPEGSAAPRRPTGSEPDQAPPASAEWSNPAP